jgi:hypothetical protein
MQAIGWTHSSILIMTYAPQPFELVSFVVAIGIITAAVLSMSSLYLGYLLFFLLMIIPQIMIMIYYGEHHHIALVNLAKRIKSFTREGDLFARVGGGRVRYLVKQYLSGSSRSVSRTNQIYR